MATGELYFADEKARRNYKIKTVVVNILLYGFLTIFALFMLVPFIFMLVGSFIDTLAFNQFTATGDFAFLAFDNWTVNNYVKIFAATTTNSMGVEVERTSFAQYFLNTFVVAVGSTLVTVITSVLSAFAFARLEFKGKNLLFTLLLSTMMIPGEMMVITNYQTTIAFGWESTFAALIFVHGVSIFYIYYLRQTFQQIPNELYLAAKVDGVGDIGYLWKVMLPIGMPTVMTIVILSLMGAWNSYVWPQLVANGMYRYDSDYDMRLVSNGLMALFQGDFGNDNTAMIAGSTVVTAPLFIFFLIFRKYIMRGVSRSGIKG